MWRQGDVFIERADVVPDNAKKLPHLVLAEGELTGHSHRITETGVAELYEHPRGFFLRIIADEATIVHQEHGPITLDRGSYRVWRQREYRPSTIASVASFNYVSD